MRVVHISNHTKPEPKPKNDGLEGVRLRMKRMQYADFQKGLKKHAELIKEVQKRIPGWMPKMSSEL